MKIRRDFVTNSSSSSFVSVLIESKELADIFREVWKDLESENWGDESYYGDGFYLSDDRIRIDFEDTGCDYFVLPEKKDDIIRSLAGSFTDLAFWENDFWEEEFCDSLEEIAKRITTRNVELTDSIRKCEMKKSEGSYGESLPWWDGEYTDSAALEKYMKEKGLTDRDQVKEEEYNAWVESIGSTGHKETFFFDRATGEEWSESEEYGI